MYTYIIIAKIFKRMYLHFTIKNYVRRFLLEKWYYDSWEEFAKNFIEKQLTLSSWFRSIERMRSSSRRKTALEVALKVGG